MVLTISAMDPQTSPKRAIAQVGAPTLDADAAIAAAEAPSLPHPDESCSEIEAGSAFTHLTDDWAEWLLELRRRAGRRGHLVIGLAAPERFEELTGDTWDESRVGMTVVSALNGPGRRVVFHSEWWLRAHWGRAFEVVSIEERDQRRIVLKKPRRSPHPGRSRRREPGDGRELAAAQANVVVSGRPARPRDAGTRSRARELREEMGRELMRRSFAAADAEWSRGGPGSPAALVAAEYEATTSWRMTKPLRTLGGLLRRDR